MRPPIDFPGQWKRTWPTTPISESQPTAALAKRKAAGHPLGRPKGSRAPRVKLDEKVDDIRLYLAIGLSKRAIANLVACSPTTLYDWLARRKIRVRPTASSRG